MAAIKRLWKACTRTKSLDEHSLHISDLPRCLGTVQLVGLGVGSGLGTGIYVIAGHVAREDAGPATALSFLIAGVSAILAALCYAEFTARVPKAGSAYVFTYIALGELLAFAVGWTLILESILGTAVVGKAWSQHLDVMLVAATVGDDDGGVGGVGGVLANATSALTVPLLGTHPDLVAFGVVWLMSLVVLAGTKFSAVINAVLALFSILVVASFACLSLFYADSKNWTQGDGFFPFGVSGVMSGAALCIYAYVGFETIATAAEECRKPDKQVPAALFITFMVTFLLFFIVTCVVTLTVPYSQLSHVAPLPNMFDQRHVTGATYIVGTGGLVALTSSLISAAFLVPRLTFSMARDGLLFPFLRTISPRTDTAWISIVLATVLSSSVALVVDLDSLIEILSAGTLLAYTCLPLSVIVLRYRPDKVGFEAGEYKKPISRETTGLSGISRSSSVVSRQTEKEEETEVGGGGVGGGGVATATTKKVKKSKSLSSLRMSKSFSESSELLTTPSGGQKYILFHAKGNSVERKKRMSTGAAAAAAAVAPKRSGASTSGSQDAELPPGGCSSSYQRYEKSLPGMAHDGAPYTNNDALAIETAVKSSEPAAEPNETTSRIVNVCACVIILLTLAASVIAELERDRLPGDPLWAIVTICVLLSLAILCVGAILRQPQSRTNLTFSVPFVPILPLFSIAINVLCIAKLPAVALVRFAGWLGLGLLIYFSYSIRRSLECSREDDQEIVLYDVAEISSDVVTNNERK
ncbi:PREDICTED: high affinity cationic amino acid transporter 1-like [Priapulus caudatus]|uniref:High affinity cationic amino acid transporter 1-like n=1 Tax=Priapulus caudatus TaxID=37621 RepID=A0ABM1DUD0_PRICU|nr:PREDICTED: high affinity cationic amino acid transporter 1-like [Priapulus caudatus]